MSKNRVLNVKSLCLSLNSDIFLIYIDWKYLIDFYIKFGSTSFPHTGGAKQVFNNFTTLSSQVNFFLYFIIYRKLYELLYIKKEIVHRKRYEKEKKYQKYNSKEIMIIIY